MVGLRFFYDDDHAKNDAQRQVAHCVRSGSAYGAAASRHNRSYQDDLVAQASGVSGAAQSGFSPACRAMPTRRRGDCRQIAKPALQRFGAAAGLRIEGLPPPQAQ
jgi:hypothetical protein